MGASQSRSGQRISNADQHIETPDSAETMFEVERDHHFIPKSKSVSLDNREVQTEKSAEIYEECILRNMKLEQELNAARQTIESLNTNLSLLQNSGQVRVVNLPPMGPLPPSDREGSKLERQMLQSKNRLLVKQLEDVQCKYEISIAQLKSKIQKLREKLSTERVQHAVEVFEAEQTITSKRILIELTRELEYRNTFAVPHWSETRLDAKMSPPQNQEAICLEELRARIDSKRETLYKSVMNLD